MKQRAAARAAALLLAATVLLGGCGSTQVTTAGGGTPLQARDVVRLVYAQSGEPGSATLPYWAGDIVPMVRRMMARFAQLRAAFEGGSAGLTSEGLVALRAPGAAEAGLRELIGAENRDREVLYAASAVEVGHGVPNQSGDWLPVERAAFAAEWSSQAPAGWWLRDERGVWTRKTETPAATGTPAR